MRPVASYFALTLLFLGCGVEPTDNVASGERRGDPVDAPTEVVSADDHAALPSASVPLAGASGGSKKGDPGKKGDDEPPLEPAESGAVFTMTNAADGNVVLAFERGKDGSLTPAGAYPTGGKGTGAGLGSQGAVTLSPDGRFLLVVDAGTSEVTSFAVHGAELEMRCRAPAGGEMPVSVAVHDGLVYVVNAGSDDVAGLRIADDGTLSPIGGSSRPLSAKGAAPAQIAFSPKGDTLVVTEKATNRVDTLAVHGDGRPGPVNAQPSEGMTPFGFAVAPSGLVVVSEAFGGAPAESALSSYRISGSDRKLQTASASVESGQTAACWVAITPDGEYAFATNTGSDNVSTYAIAASGALALVGDGSSASTGAGSAPIDIALDRQGRYAYVVGSGNATIASFRLAGGALSPLATTTLPGRAEGLAAF